MPVSPMPNRKTYRGKIRADMRSAEKHLGYLVGWDAKYLAGPFGHYPNQLWTPVQRAIILAASGQLLAFLAQLGPVPSR